MRCHESFRISKWESCYQDRISDWKFNAKCDCLSQIMNPCVIARRITFEYYRSIRKGLISNLLYTQKTTGSLRYNSSYLGFGFYAKKKRKKERFYYGN